MIVEKSLEKAGLHIQADALPKKDRTVKTFQRLIAAIRATEAEVQDRVSKAEADLNESLKANLELQERCHKLENELRAVKLQEKLSTVEALTMADRQELLEVTR